MATIFFDYDGTLHDTMRIYGPAFKIGYNKLIQQGLAQPREFEEEEISQWLGYTIDEMWKTFMPELAKEQWWPISHQIGDEMFKRIEQGKARLYDGVEDTLASLKEEGHDLVVLSNCSRIYSTKHREAFDLDRWFSGYVLSGDYPGMLKWQYFQEAAPGFEGPWIVVGDRFHDIDVATHAGIQSVGCSYGFGKPGELSEASLVVNHPLEIPSAIHSLLKM